MAARKAAKAEQEKEKAVAAKDKAVERAEKAEAAADATATGPILDHRILVRPERKGCRSGLQSEHMQWLPGLSTP